MLGQRGHGDRLTTGHRHVLPKLHVVPINCRSRSLALPSPLAMYVRGEPKQKQCTGLVARGAMHKEVSSVSIITIEGFYYLPAPVQEGRPRIPRVGVSKRMHVKNNPQHNDSIVIIMLPRHVRKETRVNKKHAT